VLLSFAAASFGGLFMPGDWYAATEEAFVESARLGVLVQCGRRSTAMDGVAAGVLRLVEARWFRAATRPLGLFLAQLALNAGMDAVVLRAEKTRRPGFRRNRFRLVFLAR